MRRPSHLPSWAWSLLVAVLAVGACGDDSRPTAEVNDTSDTQADTAEVPDAGDAGDTDTADTVTPPAAPWYETAVFYEVFVRSFQDSNGDGIGDLRGLIDRLDYLNDGVPGAGDDLEVDALWLMPIFTSDSYHGYDVVDYDAIDPDYGTRADFEALIAACEARGMKVVLDFVMNHSGAGHPWFLDARTGPSAAHRGWYLWRDDDPGWKQPFGPDKVWRPLGDVFYYGLFSTGMPDLNYREPAVATEMTRQAKAWLDRGAHGFRLDAARYLVESEDGQLFEQPETHAFWQTFRAALEDHAATNELTEPYLVGEVWTSRAAVTTYYAGGEELHQAFDFDLANAIAQALLRGSASWLRSELATASASGAPWTFNATFLSNHDLDRLSFRLSEGQVAAATLLLLTLPGTPYLYYGDELRARSVVAAGDYAKRGPMAWNASPGHGFSTNAPWLAFAPESDTRNVATALADPDSVLRHTQALIRLRKSHVALRTGELLVFAVAEPRIFAMVRREGDELVLVAVNLSADEVPAITLDLGTILASSAGPWYQDSMLDAADEPQQVTPGAVSTGATWSAHEGRIWKLESRSTPLGGAPR